MAGLFGGEVSRRWAASPSGGCSDQGGRILVGVFDTSAGGWCQSPSGQQ
jgi:hypothetical protein